MEVFQNVGIVYSETSRQYYIENGKKTDRVYSFLGSKGQLSWLVGENAYLAVNGVSNILRRWGIKFDILNENSLNECTLKHYDFLFIPNAARLNEKAIGLIQEWVRGKRKLIISGNSNLPNSLLGVEVKETYHPSKPVWIQWAEDLLFKPSHSPYPIHPSQYSIQEVRKNESSISLGTLIEFQESWVPDGVTRVIGDGVIVSESAIYFSPPIFEFIGGLLQGHIDIEELRPSLGEEADFYIDELIVYIGKVLKSYGFETMWETRLKIWGKCDHVFVLRHDVDHSKDPSYLEYEKEHSIPATYSILQDKNRKFWLEETRKVPYIERAFHFRTNKEGVVKKILRPHQFIPNPRAVLRTGLMRQTDRAQKQFRIQFKTLQRHGPFFYYPEFIEALNFAFKDFPNLLGSGTIFRYTCLRYSSSRKFFERYVVPEPHASVSFWFPFKMVITTVEHHSSLRGWESTHFIEPDEEMIQQIFKNSEKLENGVYAFGFHPAHAHRATFRQEGNFPLFVQSVKEAKERGWWFANLEMVYHRLNHWETLKFRYEEEKMMILNAADEAFYDLFIQDGLTRVHVKEVPPKEWIILKRRG